MTALPALSPTFLQAQARRDVPLLLADYGVPAVYRVQGQGAGVVVTVVIGSRLDSLFRPGRAAQGAPGETHRRRVHPLGVRHETVDAGGGVGANGGVVSLRSNDTFTVHGASVGRPAEAEVIVSVGGDVRVDEGLWTCEVR